MRRLTDKKQKASFDADEKPKAAAAKLTPSTTAKGSPVATLVSSTLPPRARGRAPRSRLSYKYSMYGHITRVEESVKAGIEEAGGSATFKHRVPETLSTEVLAKMYAPAKPAYPIITPDELAKYDTFVMGVPTRFGNFPAQWKAFWDSTSTLWSTSALAGKYAGAFTSTAGLGGGQEVTILNTISTLTHHGILYVPLGYAHTFKQLTGLEEVHGGSLWGAGTFAAADGDGVLWIFE
ncbi:flavoprotein-like protein [Mycena leptocephala]|nr:flavoprotein-like protein [Mycena leptocephala]